MACKSVKVSGQLQTSSLAFFLAESERPAYGRNPGRSLKMSLPSAIILDLDDTLFAGSEIADGC
jgi:hypothetical protein